MTSRAEYVSQSSHLFCVALMNEISVEDLKDFVSGAEEIAHERDREVTAQFKGDLEALTNHAAHMRTVAAKIIHLRDGLVPALEIDRNNPVLRGLAVQSMGYLRAEFEAMLCLLR